MLKILSLISLLLAPQARSDAPVIWSGTTAKWLPSGLHSAGLCKLDAAGVQTSGQASLATNVSGILPLANGGTNKNMTPIAGGLVYTDSDSEEVGAAGTTGQAAISGGAGAPTWFAPTAGSVLFAGTGGILAQDNANFAYNSSTNVLSITGANDSGLKVTDSGGSQLNIVDGGTAKSWFIGAQSNTFFIETGALLPFSIGGGGYSLFSQSGGVPKYQLHENLTDNSTDIPGDFVPNSGTHNLSAFVIQNYGTTVNNWSCLGFSGAGNASNNATAIDGALCGVHDAHTSASESGHLELYVENAGTLAKAMSVSKDKAVTFPVFGAGIVRSSSVGLLSSAELTNDVTTSGSNATTVAAIQGTTVSGTTGTTNVVFSSAPTLTNPVVGTQSVGDNSTKAASTAFVQAALAQLNPAAAVTAASTVNIPGTYTNSVGGVCVGDTFRVTSTVAFAPDGITLTVGQRFLMKNQTSGFQNGVWTLTTAANVGVLGALLTRALDWDSSADMNSGSLIPVISGTSNANTVWYQTAAITTCNSDSQVYTQFSGAASSSVCTPLVKTSGYSILSGDFTGCQILEVRMNCASACTLTLLAASGSGKITKVKNVNSGVVTVSGALDNDTSYIMTQQYQAAEFDDIGGSEWSVF